MDFCLIVFAVLSGVALVLLGAIGLAMRVTDKRLRARTDEVLDAIGGLRTALSEARVPANVEGSRVPTSPRGMMLPSPPSSVAATSAEDKEAIRGRWEAAEEERERSRLNKLALQAADAVNPPEERRTVEIPGERLPPFAPAEARVSAGDRDSDATQVYALPVRLVGQTQWTPQTGTPVPPLPGERATLYGLPSLADVPAERPTSDPKRTADAFREAHPTLVSAGTALERIAQLDPHELARIDEFAAERGMTRERVIGFLFATGSTTVQANDRGGRTAGPTTPPEGPANDDGKGNPNG